MIGFLHWLRVTAGWQNEKESGGGGAVVAGRFEGRAGAHGGIDGGKFLRSGEMTVFVFPATRFEIR